MNAKQNFIHSFVFQKNWRVLRHLIFWLFIYSDEVLSLFGFTTPMYDPFVSLGEFAMDVFLVYFNLYFLMPKLLLKKKIVAYAYWTIISIGVLLTLNYYLAAEWYIGEDFLSVNIQSAIFTLGILSIALVIKITKHNFIAREKLLLLAEQKSKAELKNLKNQINPHFLFNNLNSLYVLSKTKPEEVSVSIMQLSDLLRYQIYDASEKEFIELNKEVGFIKNYIGLEKIRRENLQVNLTITGNLNGQIIAPFLLLPFVENAFKHSSNLSQKPAEIDIKLNLDSKVLEFFIKNNLGDAPPKTEGGTGLKNIRKRLELLYSDRYNLSVKKDETEYATQLSINLSDSNV